MSELLFRRPKPPTQEQRNFFRALTLLRERNLDPEKKFARLVQQFGQNMGVLVERDDVGSFHVLPLPTFQELASTTQGMKAFANVMGYLIYYTLHLENQGDLEAAKKMDDVIDRLMDWFGKILPFYQIRYNDCNNPPYERRSLDGSDDLGIIDVTPLPDQLRQLSKLFTPPLDNGRTG